MAPAARDQPATGRWCGDSSTPVKTRHIYAAGVATIEEHVLCGAPAEWSLAREFIWGAQFPEPRGGTDRGARPEAATEAHDAPSPRPPRPPAYGLRLTADG